VSTGGLLIRGDTERSATMRHEVPLLVPDPFLFAEVDGRAVVLANALEHARIAAALPDAEVVAETELGRDELVAEGGTREEIDLELASRLMARLGLREAIVPPEFPVAYADRLRADGITLTVDAEAFAAFASDYYRGGPAAMPFTVRLEGGPDHGTVVGATKLGDLDLGSESAHIGWTAYDPGVWGTAVNPEAKLLLLGHCFDACGYGRVKIQTDALNTRSQAAIARLGDTLWRSIREEAQIADREMVDV